MARVSYLVFSAFLLTLATCVRSQFFADIFQGFQPFVTSRPTLKQIYEQSTRRIKTDQNRGNHYRQTTKTTTDSTTKSYENDRKVYPPAIIENETDGRKSSYNVYTTTVKPRRKDTNRLINGNKRDQATQSNFNNVKDYGKINSISDYYTQKPSYDRATDYNNNNYYTTHNPLINRPGVKPAVVDNRPPITNRPVTKRPNYGTNPRPKDEDSIAFPDDDTGPEIIMGPDEDYMSATEKKRYIELSERMCDKYKSLTTKAVQAIPLLPSPEPVSLNVTACAPTNVPLVVGGKVVGIKEFPHMALLGWRKLQGPGYSWKCGGSLVSDQFVLTAAHCTFQDRDNTVVTGPPTAVQLGSSYLDDPGALVLKVAAVIRHPKYKQPRSYYDIAIVKMVNAVKFSEVIKPACLGVPPAVGKSVIATGWGRTEYGGDQSHELRSVSLPVWSMTRCRDVLGTSRRLPDGPSPDSQLCAGEERGGKDTCQGDSGGPAQLHEGCIWRVVAVTSLGRSCGAAETPGLYAKVHRAFVASQVFGAQNWNNENKNGQNWNNENKNGQNWNNENKNGQNWNNENKNHNDQNDGYNNGSPSSQNYGNNNGQYGYNNSQKNGNNNGQHYNDNSQNYGDNQDPARPGFNRPRYTTSTARPENVNYYNNNNQNDYKENPYNNGFNQDSQNYNSRKPDNNGQSYNGDYSNSNNNRQQSDYNNYNQGTTQNSYTTQRPNRYDNSGTRYNENNNNNGQDEYTTRRNIGKNGNTNSNDNYDTQNSNNNNRDQANYNNGNNYRRPSDSYTVSKPWWL